MQLQLQLLITEHAMQDSTTTTVKDILHTIVQAIITITIVDGGGGIGDVVQQRKYKFCSVHRQLECCINTDTIEEPTMPIGEQEDIDQQAAVVQVTQDHPDTVHVSHYHYCTSVLM